MTTRKILVDYIARVEGEGALDLHIRDGKVTSAQLSIFEPPRLFEGLLRGRGFEEAPDITARICGICPVACSMAWTARCARCAGCSTAANGSKAMPCTR